MRIIYIFSILLYFSLNAEEKEKSEEKKEEIDKRYYVSFWRTQFLGDFISAEYKWRESHLIGINRSYTNYNDKLDGNLRIHFSSPGKGFVTSIQETKSLQYSGLFYRFFPIRESRFFLKPVVGITYGHTYSVNEIFGFDLQNGEVLFPPAQIKWKERQNYFLGLSTGYRIEGGAAFLDFEIGVGQRLFIERADLTVNLSGYGAYALVNNKKIDLSDLYWKKKYYEQMKLSGQGNFPYFQISYGLRF